ncbi:MAG: lipopolysaccharide kinase InaA family protein [Candidatus Binatia bacterium]
MFIPDGFERVREDRTWVLVRSDAREWLVPLLMKVGCGGAGYDMRILPGGRGGAVVVRIDAHEVVLRSCRRGGVPARVLRDTYFGRTPRPFRELCMLETLRRGGVPVVEGMGACVRWLAPGCYKGWIATRYIPDACTLWEWASGGVGQWQRPAVWRLVGKAIRRLHDAGARHPDLNLHNVLLCPGTEAPTVLLVDFDRPQWSGFRGPDADLARLRRSARKLDPQGSRVTPADLGDLLVGYREPSS